MEKLSAAAGWVTFSTVRLPTGLLMVVQKNDGRTRMIPARQAAAEGGFGRSPAPGTPNLSG